MLVELTHPSTAQIIADATSEVVSQIPEAQFSDSLSSARNNHDALEHGAAVEAKIILIKGYLAKKEQFEALAIEAIRQLHDDYGCRTSFIADRLGLAESTISGYIVAARAFPAGTMRTDVPLYRHQAVAQAVQRVQKRAEATHGIKVILDPQEVLADAISNNHKKPNEIVKFQRDKLRARLNLDNHAANAAKTIRAATGSPDILNRCHHGDYKSLVARFAARSIQIFHLDPPYSDYAHGSCLNSDMAGMTACDNDSEADALKVTCDAFSLCEKPLAPNGAILLWQSCNPLRPEIQDAIEKAGLVCSIPVAWDKGHTQPGRIESPWTQQWEALYVIHRKGDMLGNYDGSPRGNIIQFQPVQHNRASLDLTHAYQKPEDLCEFLIGKHSQEHHIVADLFGCSGAFCIAAARLKRQWIYCESNPENFAFGAGRIAQATGVPIPIDNESGSEELEEDDDPEVIPDNESEYADLATV